MQSTVRKKWKLPSDMVYEQRVRETIAMMPSGGVTSDVTSLLAHMFIGSQSNASSLRLLRRNGITHVLNCAAYCGPRPQGTPDSPYEGLGIEYYEFPAHDRDSYDITRHFDESFRFLDAAKRRGGTVLVHCAMGINRSAAVCVAYMMIDRQMPLLEAIKTIKRKRGVVLTNHGFQRQLVRFARSHNLLDTNLQNEANDHLFESASTTWKTPRDGVRYGGEWNRPRDSIGNSAAGERPRDTNDISSLKRSVLKECGKDDVGFINRMYDQAKFSTSNDGSCDSIRPSTVRINRYLH